LFRIDSFGYWPAVSVTVDSKRRTKTNSLMRRWCRSGCRDFGLQIALDSHKQAFQRFPNELLR